MILTDHFDWDMGPLPTEVRKEGDVYVVSAFGVEVRNEHLSVALDELNESVYNAISRGEIVPTY